MQRPSLGGPLWHFFKSRVADQMRGGLEVPPAGANERERQALVAGSDGVVLMRNSLDSRVITRSPGEKL